MHLNQHEKTLTAPIRQKKGDNRSTAKGEIKDRTAIITETRYIRPVTKQV